MFYLALEGLFGVGKTTVREEGFDTFLEEFFKPHPVIFFEDPLDSEHNTLLADVLQAFIYKDKSAHQKTKFLSLLAARNELLTSIAGEATRKYGANYVLVSESSFVSSMAHNLSQYPMEMLYTICMFVQGTTLPDVFLFLDAPPHVVAERLYGSASPAQVDAQAKLRKFYVDSAQYVAAQLNAQNKGFLHVIDAALPIKNVVRDAEIVLRQIFNR